MWGDKRVKVFPGDNEELYHENYYGTLKVFQYLNCVWYSSYNCRLKLQQVFWGTRVQTLYKKNVYLSITHWLLFLFYQKSTFGLKRYVFAIFTFLTKCKLITYKFIIRFSILFPQQTAIIYHNTSILKNKVDNFF